MDEAKMVCVPKKWTPEMIVAYQAACAGDADEAGATKIQQAWGDALAEAPTTHIAVPRTVAEQLAKGTFESAVAELRALLSQKGE